MGCVWNSSFDDAGEDSGKGDRKAYSMIFLIKLSGQS